MGHILPIAQFGGTSPKPGAKWPPSTAANTHTYYRMTFYTYKRLIRVISSVSQWIKYCVPSTEWYITAWRQNTTWHEWLWASMSVISGYGFCHEVWLEKESGWSLKTKGDCVSVWCEWQMCLCTTRMSLVCIVFDVPFPSCFILVKICNAQM